MSYRGLVIAAVATALFIVTAEAHAALIVTFVSTGGTDSGACTLAAPCRTLGFAVGATAGRGEIHVLNSGSYGATATINKSLTIDGGGNSVVATPITINASGATVTLRNLVLDGRRAVPIGVQINSAAVVHVENCTVEAFKTDGLQLNVADVTTYVTDSTFRDNGSVGVHLSGSSVASVVVDNSRFENNNEGLAIGHAQAAVTNSVASGNAAIGFFVDTSGQMTLERCTASHNDVGLFVNLNATARISNCVITENSGFGITNQNTVVTRQNNTVINGSNLSGNALTPLSGT